MTRLETADKLEVADQDQKDIEEENSFYSTVTDFAKFFG